MAKVITPLRYPGGKSKAIKKFIDPLLPEFNGRFLEPFVGGGSVALWITQMYPEKQILINDINFNLYCFWKTLKNDTDWLISEAHRIRDLYDPKDVEKGKELLEFAENNMNRRNSEREIGLSFYVLNKISFSGLTEHGGISKDAYEKTFNHKNIDKLKEISVLTNNFQIFNKHYPMFLITATHQDFVFLDPPYEIDEALYGKKGELQTGFDHEEFAEAVKKLDSKWMITYNDNENIRERFKDYNIVNREYTYCMSFETDESGNKHTRKTNELIITNYEV